LPASLIGLSFVPEWSLRHLREPVYLGVLGFLFVLVLLASRSSRGWSEGSGNRQVITLFLVGLPLVYVFSWILLPTDAAHLWLEILGLVFWLGFAWRALRSDLALWLGCAAHAAWDVGHLGWATFIPEWYVWACLAIDLGLGCFVFLSLRRPMPPLPGRAV
jgi:hypothetical protein